MRVKAVRPEARLGLGQIRQLINSSRTEERPQVAFQVFVTQHACRDAAVLSAIEVDILYFGKLAGVENPVD